MECIVGQSLQQKIDKVGALGLKEILRIGMQTAAGLAAAHAQGLVHRDIKPANILLENGVERVKLTDFGLARMVDDASVTQSGVIAGTPQYMSPEQARGEVVDHRSDLFSLGCVLYAMCVGHAPFRASTTMGVLKRVCEDAPRPIREGNADIPDWLAKIIIKLLAKATAHRFQTAREVADLLEQCLAHVQKPSAVSLPVEVRASEEPSPTATADSDDEPASESQSSTVGVCVIAFFVGLVPLFAAGQVSAYPELIPAGLSSRAFAALLRIAAVACWCFIPAIHWWSESRRQKPGGAGETHPGTADSVRSTHPLSPAVPTTAIPPASRSRRLWKWGILAALVGLCVWRFGPSLVLTARNVAMIRLELQDLDAKFVLKLNGKEYSNHDSRGEWYVRPGTYEIEIRPRPGRRVDRVSYFHQTLMTGHYQPVYSTTPTELYVGRGDHVKLTATFKDVPIDLNLDMNGVRDTSRPSPVEFASDRLAAEWVLSILGTVRVNDVGLDLKTISELPREPFRLTSVDLRENPSVTTAGLSCFAGCRHLSSLSISGSGLTTEGLAHFQNCGNLSSLSLGGPGLTDAGIAHFKDCRHLTSLTLAGQGVTDTGLARFREMPDLSKVILTGTHVTDAGLDMFHSAKLLRQLNLQATDVTADGINVLKQALPQCRIEWSGGVIEPTAIWPPEHAAREAGPTITTENIELVQTLPVGSLVARLLRPMDGQRLIAVGSENANDAVVKVWDSETLAEISTWRREEWLPAFEVLPLANRIVTVEADQPNGFRLRNDKTFELLTEFSNHSVAVTSLAASQDGRWLASGDHGGALILWQYDRQKNSTTFKVLAGHAQEVSTLAFSPDGSLLASGSLDKTVRVFDVATGQLKHTFDRTTDRITQVAFSPDGQALAAASWDKMAWIYDPKAGKETMALRGHTDKLTSIAFSPDGKLVATGCFDGTFLVFNRAAGHIVARANAHQNQVFGVAFLDEQPQGQRLATGHRNGMVNVWRLRPRDMTRRVASPKTDTVRSESASPPLAIAPFDAAQARQHQDRWAKHLGMPVETENSLGMKLRLIPPGKFQMGSTPEELALLKQEVEQNGASDFDKFIAQSSGPRHVVELSQPFYISRHEVTVAQFRQFVEETSYQPSAEQAGNAKFTWKSFVSDADATQQPVCGVSWDDAKAFCQWLSGKTSTDQSKQDYDLPSEAQWEYACRAGGQSLWSFGDDVAALSEHAIVGQKGASYPASVGLRRANPFGLFDMHGNVDEWCLDWHNHGFYGRSPLTDPIYNDSPKDTSSGRVARGGAWNADAWWSRSATRAYDFPTSPAFAKGFRVVGKVSP